MWNITGRWIYYHQLVFRPLAKFMHVCMFVVSVCIMCMMNLFVIEDSFGVNSPGWPQWLHQLDGHQVQHMGVHIEANYTKVLLCAIRTWNATVCGNMMTSRSCLICYLVLALAGYWVIEQPSSSLLFRHLRMQQLCGQMKVGFSISVVSVVACCIHSLVKSW